MLRRIKNLWKWSAIEPVMTVPSDRAVLEHQHGMSFGTPKAWIEAPTGNKKRLAKIINMEHETTEWSRTD